MSALENLLNLYLDSLWKEGERLTRIKLLSLFLEGLGGLRKIVIVYVKTFLSFILLTTGISSLLIYCLTTYAHTGRFPWDVAVVVLICIVALSLVSVIWSLREARWMESFAIQEKVDELVKPLIVSKAQILSPPPAIDEKKLAQLISDILDKKLAETPTQRTERPAS